MLPVAELLSRRCFEASGTKVINCVIHSNLSLTDRPTDCSLCSCDIQNRLREAVAVNAWLNRWKDDAEEVLRDKDTPYDAGRVGALENAITEASLCICEGVDPTSRKVMRIFGQVMDADAMKRVGI